MRVRTHRRSLAFLLLQLTLVATPGFANKRAIASAAAERTPAPLMLSITVASRAKGVADAVPRIVSEADRIWRRYGVTLASDAAPCLRLLRVVIVDDPGPGTFEDGEDDGNRGLGWITFVAPGRPRDILYLSWKRTLALLAETTPGRTPPEQMPDRLRETLLARALGRTLAHEIGHFLLASTAHARTGLMRRSYSAYQLFDVVSGGFDLDAAEQQRLSSPDATLWTRRSQDDPSRSSRGAGL